MATTTSTTTTTTSTTSKEEDLTSKTKLLGRFRGCLLGSAVCDAIGTTVECAKPGSFPKVTDMIGGGKYSLEPGQWTDDTSMALCLTESLLSQCKHDPEDQLKLYSRWYHDGHMSSNGECFDIGQTVLQSVKKYDRKQNRPYCGKTAPKSAGNGSLMRMAPIPLFFFADAEQAIYVAGDSSRTTHGAQTCIDSCRYYAGLVIGALNGASKDEILSSCYSPTPEGSKYWDQDGKQLHELVATIAKGSFKEKEPPAIKNGGYVIDALEAALWAFHKTTSFSEGCLLAVNNGGDADTIACIYGILAGAYYGIEGIPEDWVTKLALLPLLEVFADELFHHSTQGTISPIYKNTMQLFDELEKQYAQIMRKIRPGPRKYKNMDSFEQDRQKLASSYQELIKKIDDQQEDITTTTATATTTTTATVTILQKTDDQQIRWNRVKEGLLAEFQKRLDVNKIKIAQFVGVKI